jgi:hypothetical protein
MQLPYEEHAANLNKLMRQQEEEGGGNYNYVYFLNKNYEQT